MTTPASTYSGDPADSSLDAIRAWLGDTGGPSGTWWLLTDAEIDYVDNIARPIFGDSIMSAAICADLLAGRFAGEVSISADGVSISTADLMNKYLQLGVSLRNTYKQLATPGGYPVVGGIDAFTVCDPSVRPLNFGVGMNDNIRAGAQQGHNTSHDYYDLYDSSPW